MKEKIREAALAAGFSQVGFARAEALPSAPLFDWLSNGYHGSMHYMAREPENRLDPRKIMPECRTVICLILNYYTPYPTQANPGEGRVSRYAFGRDYHKVIRKKLKRLAGEIERISPGAKTKACSDVTPIMEKAWAEKAGLGWQGKNSNLITRDLGSWVFLAEILTDLEIEPDPPHLDFCGNCTRCIDACPTQAITEPYVVDGSRCIAYLTIETKEPVSAELAPKMNDWIFGCDICQEVCPWNRFAEPTDEPDFHPKSSFRKPLESWSRLDDETYLKEFAGTPFMRPKREHMAANAAIVMANGGKCEALHA